MQETRSFLKYKTIGSMRNTRSLFIISILSMGLFMAACSGGERDRSQLTDERAFENPEWSKDAVLYELNVRQFSEEGTFSAVESRVNELAALGVDVIWFMPIHPIGEVNRKGTLGSYYSIRDFRDVNPEFGTLDDFRSLVDRIHQAGMYVMMDWVPNHSAWDNHLAEEHPGWYVRDENGGFVSPYDWTDVIQFDWSSEGLQDYMADALIYWVEDINVDGFRVDHPHVTPADFWLRVRLEMEKVKPVLMLAENEDRVEFFQNGYDINYSWELHHLMNQVAQGKDKAAVLHQALSRDLERFPDYAYRLRFITNHDENSWAGTIAERLGEAHEAMAVFMYTIPGMPLLYNGQEAGLKLLAAAREETGLAVVTEVMTPHHVEMVCEYADVLQIGARNMQNYYLLEAVGETRTPVLLKRGPSATIDEFLLALSLIHISEPTRPY